MKKHQTEYIIWQNRALRFYLASRLLVTQELYGPGSFCGNQAIELLMKATLIYWDKSFKPLDARHNIKKMIRIIKNKIPNGKNLLLPEYFYFENRYQSVSRYPVIGKGILVPESFMSDLDSIFTDLITLVPFQFNSELMNALGGKAYRKYMIIRKGNKQLRRLRKHLGLSLSNAA